jgi:hypothetical protein
VTLLGVFLERLDERREPIAEQVLAAALDQLAHDGVVAADAAQVEHGGGGADVRARERERLVEAAHRVPDLQAHVPQRIKERLGQHGQVRIFWIVTQEDHVDVALEAECAAPVATDRHQREPALGAIAVGARGRVGGAEQCAQQTVQYGRASARQRHPARAAQDRGLEL